MPAPDSSLWPGVYEIAFESFGVRVGVGANDARVRVRLDQLVPPHSRPCDPETVEHHFTINTDDGVLYTVRYDVRDGVPAGPLEAASWVATDVDVQLALGLLETHVPAAVALRAPDWFFIHGAAVAYLDRMIVLPGPALSGKSTLVAALVRAGATYYSDQFAVLDERGYVHPYAISLGLPSTERAGAGFNGDEPLVAGEQPLPVGAIVMTSYSPGSEWRPRKLSRGESTIALMSQTIPAQENPEQSMRVIRNVLDAAPLVIESNRDEAEPVASSLLAQLEREHSASG
jgi:hypothetical protein